MNEFKDQFGVPNLRHKKVEKYPEQAYITLLPTGERMGRKIELSNKAIELLGLTNKQDQVSFSFSGINIYIVNTGDQDVPGLKVGKTTSGFSDKKHYEHIKTKIYSMQPEDTLELFFEETSNEYYGNKVYKLIKNTVSVDNNSEYTQEQLDSLNSKEYENEIATTNNEIEEVRA